MFCLFSPVSFILNRNVTVVFVLLFVKPKKECLTSRLVSVPLRTSSITGCCVFGRSSPLLLLEERKRGKKEKTRSRLKLPHSPSDLQTESGSLAGANCCHMSTENVEPWMSPVLSPCLTAQPSQPSFGTHPAVSLRGLCCCQ